MTATNRGPEAANLHILPTLWFRNTWTWGRDDRRPTLRRQFRVGRALSRPSKPSHRGLGEYRLLCEDARALLFTENETNSERLFSVSEPDTVRQRRDQRFHRPRPARSGESGTVGTKAAAHYAFRIAPGASQVVRLWFGRVGEAIEQEPSGEPGLMPRPICLPVLDQKFSSNSILSCTRAGGRRTNFTPSWSRRA